MTGFYMALSDKPVILNFGGPGFNYDISYYHNGILSFISAGSLKDGYISINADIIILAKTCNSTETDMYWPNLHHFCLPFGKVSYIDNADLQAYYKTELIADKGRCHSGCDSEYNLRYMLEKYYNQCRIEIDDKFYSSILQDANRLNCYGPFSCILSNGDYALIYNDKLDQMPICMYECDNFRINGSTEISGKGVKVFANCNTNGLNAVRLNRGELTVYKKGRKVYNSVYSDMHIQLEKLSEVSREILKFLRKVERNISLNEINEALIYDISQIEEAIALLLSRKIIMQDHSDEINWNNPSASFFTDPSKRDLINQFFGNTL